VSNFKDLTGQIFGRLTVVGLAPKLVLGKNYWDCICTCGNKKVVYTSLLTTGGTRSCGCYNREIATSSNRVAWEPIDRGTYFEIPVTGGYFAKVDKPDLELIRGSKWCYTPPGYAICTIRRKNVSMHRVIMGTQGIPSIEVDHINHDGLDNRRCNLRTCDHKHNLKNRAISSNNTTGYPGVYLDKRRGTYSSRIIINDKYIQLGSGLKLEEAIFRRKRAEKEYFGEYLNKVFLDNVVDVCA
jgi:hypothetical protein